MDMTGDTLYPLNELKTIFPEIYTKDASRYKGRDGVMQIVIPILNCLWNDVLHFTAVHPSVVKSALKSAGMKKSYDLQYYEIDPELLDPKNTAVFLYTSKLLSGNKLEVVSYDPTKIEKYSLLPQITMDYYKERYEMGGEPLVYYRVPHILYKGKLNVKDVRIIKV